MRPSVLVIDDSATFRHALAERLEESGFQVMLAGSGADALDLLSKLRVDCIVVDMVMPVMDGLTVCRKLKDQPATRDIPVVMLTSQQGPHALVEALHAGADDFVPKSDDAEVLEARLRAQLRRRQYEEDNRQMREALLEARHEADAARAHRELAETRARLLADLEAKNRELSRARDEAEAAVRAREEFLLVAAHELRTPLTALHLQLQASMKKLSGDPLAREGLDLALRQGRRLAQLVDSLLDVSRLMAGELQLRREPIDLAEVARDVARDFSGQAEQARCEVKVHADSPVHGEWDRVRITQVLSNLLSNALKYAPGKPVDVSVTRNDGEARLVVRDRGIGIEGTDQDRIFHRFERAVSTRNYGGLGLGLFVARQVVSAHGGQIQVESTPGQGATFTVRLPLRA